MLAYFLPIYFNSSVAAQDINILSVDVETNLRFTWPNQKKSFSSCYWNLNEITGQNVSFKIICQAYKIDTVCLSENYFDFITQYNDDKLDASG